MTITGAEFQAVARGITQSFDRGVREASSLYQDLCTIINSEGEDEKYSWLGDVYGMKEFLGERQFAELRGMDFTVTNKTFEQSHGFNRHKLDDARNNTFGPVARNLGQAAAQHPDELLVSLMINAGASLCYDGQYFFDTDHAEGDSGTQSNSIGASATAPTAPTVAEFQTSFRAALIAMMKFKSDTGRYFMPRVITPDMLTSLVCVVPLSMWDSAQKAFTQTFIAQAGVAVDNKNLAMPRVLPVLGLGAEGGGSDAKWDLLYTGGILKPYVFQKRAPLTRLVKGTGDIESKLIKFMSEVRYNMGYGLWQYGVRTTFS